MSIPPSDTFSLNSRSHRRRSQTRSPVSRVSFLPSSIQSPKLIQQKLRTETPQKLSMSLRHRSPNGVLTSSGTPVNGHAQGEAQGPTEGDDDERKDKLNVDWEVPRKVLHSSIGFFVIHLYTSHTSTTRVVMVLSTSCAVIACVDYFRLRRPRFAALYEKVLGFLMRESEKSKTNGVIWYLLGCIFVLSLYPQDIAVVSILILSWCDTTASFFGRLYGSRTRPLPQSIPIPFVNIRIPLPFARRKSVAGFLAGSVTGSLIALGFWGWLARFGATATSLPRALQLFDSPQPGWAIPALDKLAIVATMTGLLAGIAEALDIGSLDDNLTLPIISGGVLWALFKCTDYIFS